MVKESHLASKGKPRPCPPPSTTAVSIQPAMEVVLDNELSEGIDRRHWFDDLTPQGRQELVETCLTR
jgi:hypothetical protein